MTERHYAEAADLFKQAAALVPAGHSEEMASYLAGEADALYRQGDELGNNAALRDSISIWKETILQFRRDRVPLDWALTQTGGHRGQAAEALGVDPKTLRKWLGEPDHHEE